MASCSSNTSNEGPLNIRSIDLHDPDKEAIAVVLGEALRENYMESSVDWVTSHPNLSRQPFKLAVEGICGNTALLDFGDMSYLNSQLYIEHKYDFKQFLKNIDRHSKDSFIFGHGHCLFQNKLRELVLNTLFLSATSREVPESRNKSRLTYIDANDKKCAIGMINVNDLICHGQGTYFLSDGLTSDEYVLRVHAKGLRPSTLSSRILEGNRFINSMQEALQGRFGSEQFVALGGVYFVDNAGWIHYLVPNKWEEQKTVTPYLFNHCQVNPPETMITTFSSSTNLQLMKNKPPMILNSCQSMHSLSHHSSSVNNFCTSDSTNVEYLGYFCPATRVYRID